MEWNAGLYEASHSFVWEFGRDLLSLLAPQSGERILDVGCGTGHLTAEIAAAGARVTGVDRSPAMIAQAKQQYPAVDFDTQEATALPYVEVFDAVFSNAALHWVQAAEDAVACMARALKPGGRIVLEMGGRGNIAVLVDAAYAALRQLGVEQPEDRNPWYFPSVGEYSGMLERHGVEVDFATLFDRPTPLEDGDRALDTWFRMFGSMFTEGVEQRDEFLRLVEQYASPYLRRDGQWTADYRRLRIKGRKRLGTKPGVPAYK